LSIDSVSRKQIILEIQGKSKIPCDLKRHLIERARTEFKKGDVAYLPSSGSICFFIADVVSGKTMTPIGKLIGNIDALKDVKSGDVFRIYEETG